MDSHEKQAIRAELEALRPVTSAVMLSVSELREPGALQRWWCQDHHMRHPTFWMSANDVLAAGRSGARACPQCVRLTEKSEPIPFAEFKKAADEQQKRLDKSAEKAKSKARRRGGRPVRYAI